MRGHNNGMTVLELLLVLAISAVLMAALGGAFNASVVNCTANYQIQQTVDKARQALTRITSQLRTANYVDPYTDPCSCWLETSDGNELCYEYRPDKKALYVVTATGQEYLLCDGISNMSFWKTPTSGGTNSLAVRISLTIQAGGLQQTFSTATAIRRNLSY